MSMQRWCGFTVGLALVLTAATADAQSRRSERSWGNGDRGWGGPGCEAIIYQDVGFRGQGQRISGSMPRMARGWNDRISSIEVISGDWTFYEDDGYRGNQMRANRDMHDVGRHWNDRISSAHCESRGGWNNGGWQDGWGGGGRWNGNGRGCEAIVYRDSHFRGEPRRLSSDTPWVGDQWNDRISSIRVLSGNWVFFSDRDYRGAGLPVDRRDEVVSLDGGWNDRISSAYCER